MACPFAKYVHRHNRFTNSSTPWKPSDIATTLWYSDSVILGILSTHAIVHGWDQHIKFSLNSRKQKNSQSKRFFKSKFEWACSLVSHLSLFSPVLLQYCIVKLSSHVVTHPIMVRTCDNTFVTNTFVNYGPFLNNLVSTVIYHHIRGVSSMEICVYE